LWFLLILPILSKVFSIKIASRLMIFRKEIWILMWVMAFVHSIQYFIEPYSYMFWEIEFWWLNWNVTYLAWWFLGLIITIILTVTSNNFSIKKLWKSWKVLHRTVYILLIFSLLHVAFIKFSSENFLLELLITFIPFFLYFIWKILEWKWIKINLYKIVS
jgi:sulfoxide reductase heme-binding subunit YedZ